MTPTARRKVRQVQQAVIAVMAVLMLLLGSRTPVARALVTTKCPWTSSVVKTALGSLENLGFDGTGGMLLSRTDDHTGELYRLTPAGSGTILVPNVAAPGSITVLGTTVYFTTGNSFASGFFGRKDGTIDKVDLTSGTLSVLATGLTMPNGMARLPNGSFVVSRNLGLTTGLTKVSADGATTTRFAPTVTLTNGLTYDPSRNVVITSLDFHPVSTLALINLSQPDHIRTIDLGLFGLLGFPDDLTVGPDHLLYLAMDGGSIVRIDPDHNTACVLITALLGSTSVRFGAGPGWDPTSLYITTLTGTVQKLTPPRSIR